LKFHQFLLASVFLLTQSPALAKVVPEEQSSPAKGTKSCTIQQMTSEYLGAKYQADLKQYGYGAQQTAPIVVNVKKGGGVSMQVIADTFPQTRSYFMIAGHRYAGRGAVTVPLGPLLKEQLVQFTYTSWPEDQDFNGEDVLSGFAAAYADCVKFLG
jgi:hypothetical protein